MNIFRKIIFLFSITWLPLLILTLIQGDAINPGINISFLKDYETYTRFLIILPVIFIAERIINFQTSNSLIHFVESGIVSENNAGEYELCIRNYRRLNESKFIQIVILVVAYIKIIFFKTYFSELADSSSWKFNKTEDIITIAGYWYGFISLPLLQYIILRLFWKFLVWASFLWKVSKMNLNLVASDPDQSGGLGFLGSAQASFGILGFIQSASLSSQIANKIVYSEYTPEDFRIYLLVILVASLVYLTPLIFFSKNLAKLKMKGILIYSTLGHIYSSSFEQKWVKGEGLGIDETFLGSSDIQSLADIRSSFEIVEDMKTVPINFKYILFMFILIAFPFAPLALVKYNPVELMEMLVGFII